MGKRISDNTWRYLKKNTPDIIDGLPIVTIKLDRHNIFPNHFLLKYKHKSKTNSERYGVELGPAIDWLDENTNDEYYVEMGDDEDRLKNIIIYFHEESDAMAFKLVLGEKT